MPIDRLIVFKGKLSMTGKATAERIPDVEFENTLNFEEIIEELSNGSCLAVLPMWNSYTGEISQSGAVGSLFDTEIRVHAIWPHWIEFACICKPGTKEEEINSVISVMVAEQQCSDFLSGKTFTPVDSTTEAYKLFSEQGQWDAVLCAHDLCDHATQQVLIDNVANRLNFTIFALLGRDGEEEWIGEKWTELKSVALPKNYQISCIEMPSFGVTLTEEQHDMFDVLAEDVEHIDNIPKAIFISERGYGRTGLIIEQKDISIRAIYPDLNLGSEVKIVSDAGTTKTAYTEESKVFIPLRYPDYSAKDFVMHSGTQSCFFACPTLNIMVHGFIPEVVETFIRKSIVKHFDAIEKGIICEETQKIFFQKYRDVYHDKGADFPLFEDI